MLIKLVRDKIPEIILEDGCCAVTETIPEKDFIYWLDIKLHEELSEFDKNFDIEELVDLYEVILAICKAKRISKEQFEQLRIEKKEARGGFDKRLLLKNITNMERW